MELIDNKHKPWGMEINQFSMLMHLSQLTGFLIPFAGVILPIIMWSTNKNQNEIVNKHGKNITNWIISSFIYYLIFVMFAYGSVANFFFSFDRNFSNEPLENLFVSYGSIIIAVILIVVLGFCSIIFNIIGAVRANEGVLFKYPLTITFIS
ncbi:MAG: hypothetical protein CL821_08970 [Crocinitomicaceae bacterium]|nr:hypothetical protein [Crocinitomicaceae bacterium]|tara:strand:+ start:132 stop:584 length:453 start_codon:yes stop_codon:yes gene_type:complete